MSKRGKAGSRHSEASGLTEQMKALAAAALAEKVGYLRRDDFPAARTLDDLPARSYGPHKIIRCPEGELFLVARGLVEVWHPHHDLLIKKLLVGTLFGEMRLLGQTMIVTQAVSGSAGATVAVISTDRAKRLIAANPMALAEKLCPRLAATADEHYRAVFQRAESRVAALLLELAGDGLTVEGFTQRQLGERLGMVRETVVAAIAMMKARRLIAVDRRQTIIIDRRAVEALSRL
jgi:CRP-like cAMP-binding protein